MRNIKIPHTFVIIAVVLLVCGVLTWIVPAGEFERTTTIVNGSEREVIIENSYHHTTSSPQSWQIIGSIVDGFKKQAGIIAFILIIGGAFALLNYTQAIDYGIKSFLAKSKKFEEKPLLRRLGVGNTVIVGCMLIFSLFGAVFGMSEETIAFVIIIVPLTISLGYDSITGLLMVYVAAHIGFSGAMFNPFTIGIAQGLSGVPVFSGFEYRFFVWIILTLLIILFTLHYANKIKKHPELSPTYNIDKQWRTARTGSDGQITQSGNHKAKKSTWAVYGALLVLLTIYAVKYPQIEITIGVMSREFICLPVIACAFAILGYFSLRKGTMPFILTILLFTIVILIVGVLGYGWYISEIATLFICMGVAACAAAGVGSNKIATEFISGAKDILSAALVVGLAGGIIEILSNGKILDTILYALSGSLDKSGKIANIGAMYGIQTILNLFIPSGSAKAALTMPIMAPFSDIIGISRQATIMAFQFGDGFTNMITPTSGVLIGALGAAKVPYSVWIKWFWKVVVLFIAVGFLLLIPTVIFTLPGF